MRAIALCHCCPRGAGQPRQKPPTGERGEKALAMAGLSTVELEAKCVWQGEYLNWKEKVTQLNEYKVGLVTPDQIVTLLKKAKYLDSHLGDLEAKFVDINWKALTGFLYEKSFEVWKVIPVDGREICEVLTNGGPPADDGRACPHQYPRG